MSDAISGAGTTKITNMSLEIMDLILWWETKMLLNELYSD